MGGWSNEGVQVQAQVNNGAGGIRNGRWRYRFMMLIMT